MSTLAPVTISLPFAPSSAAVARRRLQQWLTDVGADTEVIEDSRLVLSELIGNAVRHAAPLDDGTVQVAWTPADDTALEIAVTDGGAPTAPAVSEVDDGAESGRGLGIVEQLAARWWLETTRTRSTVHALMHLAPSSAAGTRTAAAG